MDNSPVHLVEYQESFEVRKEGTPLAVTENVKVTVVGIVLAGRVVPEERNAHIGIPSILGDSLHRDKRRGGHQTDMIQKPSHLNFIYGMEAPT